MSAVVVDASAMVELLLASEPGRRVARHLRTTAAAVPSHLDAEVLSALGRLVRAGEIEEEQVAPRLGALTRAPITRFSVAPLLTEAWRLRHNVALRDAVYVALARRLDCALLTGDRKLARAPDLGIAVTVV